MSLEQSMRKTGVSGRDFYQTPEVCVIALCNFIKQNSSNNKTILDPCAGNKPIGNVLRRYGYSVDEIDLYCGPESERIDFLEHDFNTHYDYVIMNPPFSRKEEFIKKALNVSDTVFCILSTQVLNYNRFSREILSTKEYKGRLKMIPKFFMSDEPQRDKLKLGGNAQYSWFVFSNNQWGIFDENDFSFETQVDLLEIGFTS